jgi:hypothetical protein
MVFGLSTSTFTLIHVILSLVGILAGAIVLFGMLASKRPNAWTDIFLVTMVLTSVTGFAFPGDQILPSHIVGVISLLVLAGAIVARYLYRLAGKWRWIYVAGVVVSFYFNVFVGVVQAFGKLPFLSALAPTQSEPPFVVTQVVVLLIFVGLGIAALRSFYPGTTGPALGKA